MALSASGYRKEQTKDNQPSLQAVWFQSEVLWVLRVCSFAGLVAMERERGVGPRGVLHLCWCHVVTAGLQCTGLLSSAESSPSSSSLGGCFSNPSYRTLGPCTYATHYAKTDKRTPAKVGPPSTPNFHWDVTIRSLGETTTLWTQSNKKAQIFNTNQTYKDYQKWIWRMKNVLGLNFEF